jgi:hypothetical protein
MTFLISPIPSLTSASYISIGLDNITEKLIKIAKIHLICHLANIHIPLKTTELNVIIMDIKKKNYPTSRKDGDRHRSWTLSTSGGHSHI